MPEPEAGAGDRYAPYVTETFRLRLEEVRARDPGSHARIAAVMERLREHPEDADGRMHGALRGMLKKYVGRGEWRILYNACTACRKANLHLVRACAHCGQIPDRSVVFFDLYRKNERAPG
jgi:hypothetical protein